MGGSHTDIPAQAYRLMGEVEEVEVVEVKEVKEVEALLSEVLTKLPTPSIIP